MLVERKAPPMIDYAVRIISKHILGKFSILVMFQKFWPLANLSRSKMKVQVIFGAAFHKLKYERSLKSRSKVKVKVIFGAGFHRLKYEPSLKSL